jgi:hypothetical protein
VTTRSIRNIPSNIRRSCVLIGFVVDHFYGAGPVAPCSRDRTVRYRRKFLGVKITLEPRPFILAQLGEIAIRVDVVDASLVADQPSKSQHMNRAVIL